ncbi:hypothetical protein AB0425_25660 [Actinosynnema sp. NPDC051121]
MPITLSEEQPPPAPLPRRHWMLYILPVAFITTVLLGESGLVSTVQPGIVPLATAFGLQTFGHLAMDLWRRFRPGDITIAITVSAHGRPPRAKKLAAIKSGTDSR